MALPVNIDSDTEVGAQNSYHGPVKSPGGTFYTILIRTSINNTLRPKRATDPTSSFSTVDFSWPVFGVTSTNIVSMWQALAGDDIHVIGQNNIHDVYYARLLTDDGSGDENTWQDVDGSGNEEVLIDTTGSTQTADACTIAVRSDADIVVGYQGDSDMLMGTEYERIDWNVSTDGGKTWAGPVSIDNGAGGGNKHWTGCVIVPGSSDRMHVFFKDDTNADAYQRRINSDDSLETFPSAFDTATNALNYLFGAGVSYDDGGTQRVRCPYSESTQKVSVAKCNSEDTPTVTEDADVSGTTHHIQNNGLTAVLAVDTKNLQLLYSDNASKDLFRDTNDDDAGWGTDTEELDGVTVNHISSKVYDRSGTKLAFIYDDGGTVKYNEIALAAVAIPVINLVMAPYIPA